MTQVQKLEIGETYQVEHSRKGKWQARLLKITGEGTDDVWYTMSDDVSSPIRASLTTLTKV